MFKPVGNFLLLNPEKESGLSPSGLIIIPDGSRNHLNQGTIIAVGESVDDSTYHVGDEVVFNKHSEYHVKLEGQERILVAVENLLLHDCKNSNPIPKFPSEA